MNIFRKNNILVGQLLRQSFDFLQLTFNQTRNIFTVASAWGQILFVLQNLSQLILYFIEDSITELNINQATRDYSIRSLARIAGYDSGRASSARGEVTLSWNKREGDVGGGAVLIDNNTIIRNEQNGLTYVLRLPGPRVRLNLVSDTILRTSIIQGVTDSATFTGSGNLLQSYNIPSRSGIYIDQFNVDVYVNNEQWKRYDSLYDIPLNGKGYLVKTGISEGIDVYFGNVNFGAPPPPGSVIRVDFIQTAGFTGNIASTKDKPLTFTFASLGSDLFGAEVNLNNYIQIQNSIDPSFGTDPEPIQLVRLVAPKTSRSYVFANTVNYEIYLERLGIFSQIQAFTTFDDEYLDDDNVVYLFLVPDVTLTLTTNEDYFDIALNEFLLTNQQRLAILNLLEETGQMIATTVVKIVQPTISKYIGLAVIDIFEGFDPNIIESKIRSGISEYFLNLKRRDRVPKSDLIALIEAVEGVDSVDFSFLGEQNEANAIKAIDAGVNPSSLIGIDQFGNIVIGRNELVVLRGGWTDRYGTNYEEGIVPGKPSALNVTVRGVIPRNYNAERNISQRRALIEGING
jgi:hypothetical protein